MPHGFVFYRLPHSRQRDEVVVVDCDARNLDPEWATNLDLNGLNIREVDRVLAADLAIGEQSVLGDEHPLLS